MVRIFTWGDDIEKGKKDLIIVKKLCYKKVTVGGDMA